MPPPSPLLLACCEILILHTLLAKAMNYASCLRNPQSHASGPPRITPLLSLLPRWITEWGGIWWDMVLTSLFVFCVKSLLCDGVLCVLNQRWILWFFRGWKRRSRLKQRAICNRHVYNIWLPCEHFVLKWEMINCKF